MPYEKRIDERIRSIVDGMEMISSRKMFGGICHMLLGNMFCGVYKNFLILRLGKETAESSLSAPHVRPFDITGKPMKGWIMVEEKGIETDEALNGWIEKALKFASTLPAK